MKMAKMHLSLFILAAIGCTFMGSVGAMNHIVGGSFGWNIPVNKTFYEDWAKPRRFGIHDKLMFLFRTDVHNVVEVNKQEFDACTKVHVIETFHSGPTIVALNKTGERHFYCGIGKHCEAGIKLSITVTDKPGSAGTLDAASMPSGSSKLESSDHESSTNSIRNIGMFSGLLSLLLWLFI